MAHLTGYSRSHLTIHHSPMHLAIYHKKHKLPIEYAASQPFKAIRSIMQDTCIESLQMETYNWYSIVTEYIYEDFMERLRLSYFHQRLMRALHILNIKRHPGDQSPFGDLTEVAQQVIVS